MQYYSLLVLALFLCNNTLLFSMKRSLENREILPYSPRQQAGFSTLPYELVETILMKNVVETSISSLSQSRAILNKLNRDINSIALTCKCFSHIVQQDNFIYSLIDQLRFIHNKYSKIGNGCLAKKIGTLASKRYYNLHNDLLKKVRKDTLVNLNTYLKNNKLHLNYTNFLFTKYVNPLEAACISLNNAKIELLVHNGADPLMLGKGGRTLIETVVAEGCLKRNRDKLITLHDIIFLLQQYGVSINTGNNKGGHSPLSNACLHDNHEVVKILIELGANPHIPYNYEYQKGWPFCIAGRNQLVLHELNKYQSL